HCGPLDERGAAACEPRAPPCARSSPRSRCRSTRQREVVGAFLAAAHSGDFDALLAVLDPGVVLRVDGGLVPAGVSRVIRGSQAVAGQALAFSRLGLVIRTRS